MNTHIIPAGTDEILTERRIMKKRVESNKAQGSCLPWAY